jgi:hypothetical protein
MYRGGEEFAALTSRVSRARPGPTCHGLRRQSAWRLPKHCQKLLRRLDLTRIESNGRLRYLTATHGHLPSRVSAATTGVYVALQAGVRGQRTAMRKLPSPADQKTPRRYLGPVIVADNLFAKVGPVDLEEALEDVSVGPTI